jgi:hypothetical protein
MTLLGKILILFNLLAAGGFVYLATQDWKGRQAITARALQFKLFLSGLPFENKDPDKFDAEDETPFVVELAGSFQTETVSKKIVTDYFKADPGSTLGDKSPVPCQVAEIRRVQNKIRTLLGDKDAADKAKMLHDWLIDQCENYEQRVEVQTLAAKGDATELEKRLMAMFDAVLSPPVAAAGDAAVKAADGADVKALEQKIQQVAESRSKPLDQFERQNRATQLLAFLDTADPGWQRRVMIVVGLRRYVAATAVLASRYKDMATRLNQLIVTDQKGYLDQEITLNALARSRTDLANLQAKLKEEKVEEKKKEDDFVARRTTQLNDIVTELQKVKAEVDEMLVKQGRIEAGLFDVQREVAVTLDEVYALEAQLAAREQELLKASKK